jgi:hypothetical protein
MHIVEEALGRQLVLAHQPGEGRAVAVIIVLLNALGLLVADAEELRDERPHPLIHLREQVALGRVERVVQVEYPGADAGEGGEGGGGKEVHGEKIRAAATLVIQTLI